MTQVWNAMTYPFSRSLNANDLFDAAKQGNIYNLQYLIDGGLHPNAISDSGATPL